MTANDWLKLVLEHTQNLETSPPGLRPDQRSWLYRVAVHEAGHAVYAVMNGWLIEYIAIRPRQLLTDPGDTQVYVPDFVDAPLYFASGAAAEEKVFGSIADWGSTVDLERHAELSSNAFEASVAGAKPLLCKHHIIAVADLLMKQKRLDREQICHAIGIKVSW